MESILRGLYSGKVVPWERRAPRSEEHLEIVRKIEREEQHFMQKMSLDDCQRFQALSQLYNELLSSDEDSIFAYGFTLGMLLTLDVMREAETLKN